VLDPATADGLPAGFPGPAATPASDAAPLHQTEESAPSPAGAAAQSPIPATPETPTATVPAPAAPTSSPPPPAKAAIANVKTGTETDSTAAATACADASASVKEEQVSTGGAPLVAPSAPPPQGANLIVPTQHDRGVTSEKVPDALAPAPAPAPALADPQKDDSQRLHALEHQLELSSLRTTNAQRSAPAASAPAAAPTAPFVSDPPVLDGFTVRKWPDGKEYRGEVRGGLRHGKGVLTYADGATYDGEWRSDQRHGTGQYRSCPRALSPGMVPA
jgi:hypothetical protein